MRKIAINSIVLCAALVAVSALEAAVKMPRIFSDNMLVQREKPAKFWGTADPDAKVEIEFAGQKKSTTAGADGKWSLSLKPLKASAAPRDMLVYENGKLSATIKNVLVGELWILSGQSNMQWTLKATEDVKDATARANYPNLRYFKMSQGAMSEKPLSDFGAEAHWELTTPQNVQSYSAVGFYFGEKLLNDLNVPVGLIQTAMGGTLMACWTPQEYIETVPYQKGYYQKYLKDSEAYVKSGEYPKRLATYKKNLAEHEAACKKADAEGKPRPPYDWNKLAYPLAYTPYRTHEVPVFHWNAKIAPMAGITARGVVWYQGEQESGYGGGNKPAVDSFGAMYQNMVNAWREKWGDEKLWFLSVALPSFGGGKLWAPLRSQQLSAVKNLKYAQIANTIDTGYENDVHPHDKTLVGQRVAKLAEKSVYNKKKMSAAEAFAPEFVSADFKKDGVLVKFDTFGGKLVGKGEPRGFELEIDGKWVEAIPEIRGKRVFVAAPDGAGTPTAVRYLWKPWAKPQVWLYSNTDLPAFPFECVKK